MNALRDQAFLINAEAFSSEREVVAHGNYELQLFSTVIRCYGWSDPIDDAHELKLAKQYAELASLNPDVTRWRTHEDAAVSE